MGRWGLSELPAPDRNVVGSDEPPGVRGADSGFTKEQTRRFLDATATTRDVTRHLANSAAALRYPAARGSTPLGAGSPLYGISPFGGDPSDDDLRPALRWESELAQVKQLCSGRAPATDGATSPSGRPGSGSSLSGYADGFRRDMTGTEVLVAGERCRVVGTVSMDAFAVELPAELPVGSPVTLLGDGMLAEEHARVADTIALRDRVRAEHTGAQGATRGGRCLTLSRCGSRCRRSVRPTSPRACSGYWPRSAARNGRWTSAAGAGALASRSRRTCVRSSASTARPSCSTPRASARRAIARFSKATRRHSRSAGASSTSSAVCASSITCVVRSWSSQSSRA